MASRESVPTRREERPRAAPKSSPNASPVAPVPPSVAPAALWALVLAPLPSAAAATALRTSLARSGSFGALRHNASHHAHPCKTGALLKSECHNCAFAVAHSLQRLVRKRSSPALAREGEEGAFLQWGECHPDQQRAEVTGEPVHALVCRRHGRHGQQHDLLALGQNVLSCRLDSEGCQHGERPSGPEGGDLAHPPRRDPARKVCARAAARERVGSKMSVKAHVADAAGGCNAHAVRCIDPRCMPRCRGMMERQAR